MFTHDTSSSLEGMAALVNTRPEDRQEGLPTIASLNEFVRAWEYTGSRTRDFAELLAVRELREVLLSFWIAASEAEVAEQVNAILRESGALPQLVDHDGWGWHVHATDPSRPLATRMAVEYAMAVVDLVRTGDLERLRRCAADNCSRVLVDLSKNRSRRYCDGTCANTTHVRAYRKRHSS